PQRADEQFITTPSAIIQALFARVFSSHDGSRQELRTSRNRGQVVSDLGIARIFQAELCARCTVLLHPAAAAQRNGHAAHGPRVSTDPHGSLDSLSPDAG